MIDLKKLRLLAEGATPGPWRWHNPNTLIADHGRRDMVLGVSSHNRTPYLTTISENKRLAQQITESHPVAEFIAAVNPKTVQVLLDVIEKQREIIIGEIRGHYFLMNKEYLADAAIKDALAETDKLLGGGE